MTILFGHARSWLFTLIGLLAPLAAMSQQAASDSDSWRDGPKPRYVELCSGKIPQDNERYRLCVEFFQKSFSAENFPDTAIFLRKRLNNLIPNYQAAAETAFMKFEYVTYAVLLVGFISLAGAAIMPAILSKTIVFTALGATLIAALSAFGFNAQFKANFSAYRELSSLRDEVELKLVEAARTGTGVPTEFIDASVQAYKTIVNTHANAFGSSLSSPTSMIAN